MIGTKAVILKTNLETLTFPGDFYDSQNQMHVVKFLQFETDNSALFTTVITAALIVAPSQTESHRGAFWALCYSKFMLTACQMQLKSLG